MVRIEPVVAYLNFHNLKLWMAPSIYAKIGGVFLPPKHLKGKMWMS